jgi:hypothetical protein
MSIEKLSPRLKTNKFMDNNLKHLLQQLVISAREMDKNEMQRTSQIDNVVFHLHRKGVLSTLNNSEHQLLDWLKAYTSPHQKVVNHQFSNSIHSH